MATKRRIGGVVLSAALAVTMAPSGPAAAAPGEDRADLRTAMAELTEAGAVGVQVRVHDDDGDWTGSAGKRELRGGAVPTNGRFRAGSITKTFVTTVVLQLVDEGKVVLDDPVATYLPEYGLDPRITVRMMLQHTTGLFNYTGEPRPDGSIEPGIPLYGPDFADNQFHHYRPDELIEVALSKPPRFEPGTDWRYSNTNFVLAGQLVERVTGDSYADQIRRRVLAPLHLRETYLPGWWYGIPGPHAHGYYAYQGDGRLQVLDVSRVDPSWAGSAGEIISTTRDLDTFIDALLGGRLLPPHLLAEMREQVPGAAYGMGMELFDAGPECGGRFYGHSGGMHGYQSFMLSTGDRGTRVEMSVTIGPFDDGDPEAVQRFATAEGNLLVTAMCGDAPGAPSARSLVAVPRG